MMYKSSKQILLLTAILSVLGCQKGCDCRRKSLDQEKNPPVSLVDFSKTFLNRDPLNDAKYIPVIIWHGSGDTASSQLILSSPILKVYEKTPVFAIRVGETDDQDVEASIWGDANVQIEQACQAIIENELINERKIVNFIGLSQGALLIRGLIERCPFEEYSIKVNNFVSVGGPQQGVYGFPKEMIKGKLSSSLVSRGVSLLAYMNHFQKSCMPASYWHDPKSDASYRKKTFLADINNEGLTYHEEYKKRFQSINKLVLIKFNRETIIFPQETSHFGFYAIGSTKNILPMNETELYKKDLIGLKVLNENQQIDFMEHDRDHLDFSQNWFRHTIAEVYLGPKDLDK